MSTNLAPPPDLTPEEAQHWTYYAPLLHQAGRFTPDLRGALTNYCTVRATIDRLRQQQRMPEYRDVIIAITVDGAGNEHVKATPNPILIRLESQMKIARSLECDLILNPATAIRTPKTLDPDTPATDGPRDFFGGLKRVG